jgi:ABC-type molybdate transport system permease subunit
MPVVSGFLLPGHVRAESQFFSMTYDNIGSYFFSPSGAVYAKKAQISLPLTPQRVSNRDPASF